ncbi:hypothetical protein ACVRWE_08015 [Streptococcus urinalis]|uniref:Uncharacterized protein n=1 Tax=Streptococcus urinalis 2285-97 TaxID=764291 RepID=G5KCN1_9STRE|nr:hypothetical protein [Streptococcus urinalis]EHJ55716.1 hypothetical protein STRUR_0466 [Streptococcus urinalis 2285-97]
MYRRDYYLLNLHWQNINQLYTRGSTQWISMGLMFGNLILAGILVFLFVIISTMINPSLVSILMIMIVGVLTFFVQKYLNKHFWSQFE